MLAELQTTIAAVAERTAASVVRIHGGTHRGGPRTVGVIIEEGRVLTNAHGVPPGGEVSVAFADGETVTATVAARDHDGDLAVLQLDTGERPALAWADDAPALGSPVITVTPSRGSVRATFGTVSAVGRRFRGPGGRPIEDGIEHTAPLARGSSGSPILDPEGRLLGINTHRTEPFYIAMPVSERLRARADALGRGEAPVRRHLGVAVAPPHVAAKLRSAVGLPARSGVLVRDVDADGPAAAAGVERGDLIVAAAGTDVGSPDELHAVLADAPDELTLTLVRGEVEREVTVRFGAG